MSVWKAVNTEGKFLISIALNFYLSKIPRPSKRVPDCLFNNPLMDVTRTEAQTALGCQGSPGRGKTREGVDIFPLKCFLDKCLISTLYTQN